MIEMMVVITVIGLLSTMGIFGYQKYNNDQPVVNARDEFIANVREAQNKVNNGANGQSVMRLVLPDTTSGPASLYRMGGTVGTDSLTYNLPAGVTLLKNITVPNDTNSLSRIVVCLTNPALSAFTPATTPAPGITTNGCGWGGAQWGLCPNPGDCSRSSVYRNTWWEWYNMPDWNGNVNFDVIFSKGSTSRTVKVEIVGMTLTRIYAQ